MTIGKDKKREDQRTHTNSSININDLCLCDVAKYAGEWPQLAEIKELKDLHAVVHWYKGSKTTSWVPCTRRSRNTSRWEPWLEEIALSDIWCHGFQLTGAKKLTQKIKDKLDDYIH